MLLCPGGESVLFWLNPLSLFILDIFEKEGQTEVEKKSESVNVWSGWSAQVGKKARHNA
jgi:hypothetical protein